MTKERWMYLCVVKQKRVNCLSEWRAWKQVSGEESAFIEEAAFDEAGAIDEEGASFDP